MNRHLHCMTAGILALAGLALFANSASAQYRYHDPFHNYLDQRQFQRDVYHYQAHQYPMTHWQHRQLHNSLNHDAYHDHLLDRQYHRLQNNYYAPTYGGSYYGGSYYPQNQGFSFGFQNRNFGIYFGR